MSQPTAQRLTIAAEEYHARPELSASMLKVFADSPRLFYKRFVERTISDEPSPAMILGRLAHAAILEPHLLEGHCIRIPREVLNEQGHRRGKAWTEFKQANEGRVLLGDDDYNRIKAMFDAVYANEFAARLLRSDGEAEATILWNIGEQPLRSRLDRLLPNIIVDIKTCREGTARDFARSSFWPLRYALQAAFYQDAAESLDGVRRRFLFVCVESNEPYRAFVCEPSEEALEVGRNEYRVALEMIEECRRTGDWRDDDEKIINRIEVPEWKRQQNRI